MLFSSIEFLFLFLPAVMLAGLLTRRVAPAVVVVGFALAANLYFYGWFKLSYLALLVGSIGVNYIIGVLLIRKPRRAWLVVGIVLNLALLGFYKYAGFFASSVGLDFSVLNTLVLPLAISFYTFQQISFLVDCYRGDIEEVGFLRYAVYVSFFPQLIAGPIVRFAELYPQLREHLFRPDRMMLAAGLTLFVFGLAKKVLIADELSGPVNQIWASVAGSQGIATLDAWYAVLAYSMQIYFDFSAYSDMAIGLGLMMGVQLPVNFLSPYRAVTIRDFWRRWHITLSLWLRDYLYIPLGGSRKGRARQMIAVTITMALGGLWHGAGWNFVLWGMLHGAWIVVSHLVRGTALSAENPTGLRRIVATAITFTGVSLLWVFFRGENGLWIEMLAHLGPSVDAIASSVQRADLVVLAIGCALAFFAPSNARMFGVVDDECRLRFKPGVLFALASAVLFFLVVLRMIEGEPNAFIYFQF